jgi:hypothetical protein
MQRSRRTVLASLPVVLAGCGRSFRQNSVPGGLFIENRRRQQVTVTVRAARLTPQETAAGTDATPTERPDTPPAEAVASPSLTGEYEVAAGTERGIPDFFPEAGHWALEAVVGDDDGNRTRIELYAAIPGPTGADTVRIRVSPGDVTARATTVD